MIKHCIGIVVLICCFIHLNLQDAFGQSDAPEDSTRIYALRDAKWALQFEAERDINLEPFQGAVISFKRHLSPYKALRIGLDFAVDFSDGDSENSSNIVFDPPISSSPDTIRNTNESDSNSQQIGLTTQYILYPAPRARVKFFYGAGPLIRWSRNHSESNMTSHQSGSSGGVTIMSKNKSAGTTWTFGLSGVIGAEWFATDRISIMAEYGLTIQYGIGKQTSTGTTTRLVGMDTSSNTSIRNESRSDSLDIDPSKVKLGVSFYF